MGICSRTTVMRHINRRSPPQQIRRTACAGESSRPDSRPCSRRDLDADHFPRPRTPCPPYVKLASTRPPNRHGERSAIAYLAAVLDGREQFDVLDFLPAAHPVTEPRSTRSPMPTNRAPRCRAACRPLQLAPRARKRVAASFARPSAPPGSPSIASTSSHRSASMSAGRIRPSGHRTFRAPPSRRTNGTDSRARANLSRFAR